MVGRKTGYDCRDVNLLDTGVGFKIVRIEEIPTDWDAVVDHVSTPTRLCHENCNPLSLEESVC